MRFLVLDLRAPLMSFGGPIVDDRGVIARFPALSMLAGLCANALGWDHAERGRTQDLQDRMTMAARVDRPGTLLHDFQTAELRKDDKAWTTRGVPETRAGGPATYDSPLIRRQQYWADAAVTCVLGLEAGDGPGVTVLADAFARPARPLFLGRKACLPAGPLCAGTIEAEDALQAVSAVPAAAPGRVDAQWPAELGGPEGTDRLVHDLRDWRGNMHAGARVVREGRIEVRAPHPAQGGEGAP